MAWLFLAPNLMIFGLFTFLPIILNFFYATTGGANILLRTGRSSAPRTFGPC